MADGCGILQLNLRNRLLQLSMKRIMKSMRIPRRKPGDATGLKEGYQTRNPNFFPAFAHAEITPTPKKKNNKIQRAAGMAVELEESENRGLSCP
jgi:hypothetical protein